MLNTMSEKKKKKLIEFKIVKSPENETPRDLNSASPNIKIRKNSSVKKKMMMSDQDDDATNKIKICKMAMFSSNIEITRENTKEEVKFKN